MATSSYRQVLKAPGVSFLLATSLVARLPVAMVNLAIILRVAHATGSYARAGVTTAVYVLGTAAGVPLLGRLADRVGRRPVLLIAAAVNAAGLIALAVIPVHATALLFVVAVIAGASLPPVAPAVRSLWRKLVDEDLASSLYAIDASLQEMTFMAGPALVALISTLANPAAALLASGLIGFAGTVAVTLHPSMAGSSAPPQAIPSVADVPIDGLIAAEPHPSRRSPSARSASLATLVAMTLLFLTAIVIVEVTVVAFAGRHHASHEAGLLLATWSLGSLIGGLSLGARAARSSSRVVAPLILVTAGGFALLALAPNIPSLYFLLFVAGVAIAPAFSCIYDLVGRTSPPEVSVEAFSWVASAIQVGAACGAAIGGIIVQGAGARTALICGALVAVGTAAVGWSGRRFLVQAPVPVSSGG